MHFNIVDGLYSPNQQTTALGQRPIKCTCHRASHNMLKLSQPVFYRLVYKDCSRRR